MLDCYIGKQPFRKGPARATGSLRATADIERHVLIEPGIALVREA